MKTFNQLKAEVIKTPEGEEIYKRELAIGMLRQWINELPADRLVTNEDLYKWLKDVI